MCPFSDLFYIYFIIFMLFMSTGDIDKNFNFVVLVTVTNDILIYSILDQTSSLHVGKAENSSFCLLVYVCIFHRS